MDSREQAGAHEPGTGHDPIERVEALAMALGPESKDSADVGPTLDEQVDHLLDLGLPLYPEVDRETLWRAVSRGVSSEDVRTGYGAAEEISPHRRSAYWWLLCEDLAGRPVLADRVVLNLELFLDPDILGTDELDPEEHLELIRSAAAGVALHVRRPLPGTAVVAADADRLIVEIGGALYDWTDKESRDQLRDVIERILPRRVRVLMYRDVADQVPDECVIVPSRHAGAVQSLLEQVLPEVSSAAREWKRLVSGGTPAAEAPLLLEVGQMTSGLAEDSRDIGPWEGVHPPMPLAVQLEQLADVGFVPWSSHVALQLPARPPSRVPRMVDRPFRDLFALQEDSGLGLLRGVVGVPLGLRGRQGSRIGAGILLTEVLRSMAQATRPSLEVPPVDVTSRADRSLHVVAQIDGVTVSDVLVHTEEPEEIWDAGPFLERASRALAPEGMSWVRLAQTPPEASSPLVPFACVSVGHIEAVQRMARIAFGDVGRHLTASRQEELWWRWVDQRRSRALLEGMTAAERLAVLERAGMPVRWAEDHEHAALAVQEDSWRRILDASRRGLQSDFESVYWIYPGAFEDFDELPELVEEMAAAAGIRGVSMTYLRREGDERTYLLNVDGGQQQIAVFLSDGDDYMPVLWQVAQEICPMEREAIWFGGYFLWVFEEQAPWMQTLLLGG